MEKNKILINILIVTSSFLAICIIVISLLFYLKTKENISLRTELEKSKNEYNLALDSKSSLEKEYNNLKSENDILLLKLKIFPQKPEDNITFSVKLEKVYQSIKGQVEAILYLKTTNSYKDLVANLNKTVTDKETEVSTTITNYWNSAMKLEKNTSNDYRALDIKLYTKQISKATYDKSWSDVTENYNSSYEKINKEIEDKSKEIGEKYNPQFTDFYNNNLSEINNANIEANDRMNNLNESIKTLTGEYDINKYHSIIIGDDEFKAFGLEDIFNQYKKEINSIIIYIPKTDK